MYYLKHRPGCIHITVAAYLAQNDILSGRRLVQTKLAAAYYDMLTVLFKSVFLTGVAVLLFNVFGKQTISYLKDMVILLPEPNRSLKYWSCLLRVMWRHNSRHGA